MVIDMIMEGDTINTPERADTRVLRQGHRLEETVHIVIAKPEAGATVTLSSTQKGLCPKTRGHHLSNTHTTTRTLCPDIIGYLHHINNHRREGDTLMTSVADLFLHLLHLRRDLMQLCTRHGIILTAAPEVCPAIS
jgi:hypothetical protein